MSIKLDFQTKHFIRALGRRGSELQQTAALALNEMAEELENEYKRRLQTRQTVRTKYTLNSVHTYRANPIRRSGEPRPIHRINAVVGVRKMRGGKKHYLAELEDGKTQRGNPLTQNRVAIPMESARTSQSRRKPISSPLRLTKGKPQILTAGGQPFGVPGDRRSYGDRWKTDRQRIAALYRYKSGKGRLNGDLSKPFFFIDTKGKRGVFVFKRSKLTRIRDLEKTRVRTKRRPNFGETVHRMTPQRIRQRFVRIAQTRVR